LMAGFIGAVKLVEYVCPNPKSYEERCRESNVKWGIENESNSRYRYYEDNYESCPDTCLACIQNIVREEIRRGR